jgi:Na+/H+ antiporter NhaD/arsenite permease-like protein
MKEIVHIIIIVLIMVGIAIGKYPVFRMNRATITLIGATLLILTKAISLQEAYSAIDGNTIILLFSMMIINANLHVSGFFALVAKKVLILAKKPTHLLLLVIISSGLLSALFLNDTVVLIFTPLIIEISYYFKQNPIPYLIALAVSANIGSVATIIGNPQNMIIGIYSKISFGRFTMTLLPIALLNLFIAYLIIIIIYRKQFQKADLQILSTPKIHIYRPLLIKSLLVMGGILILLISGIIPIAMATLTGASVLLFTRRLKPERVFNEINWTLLVFFSALFVVTKSIETSGIIYNLQSFIGGLANKSVAEIAIISAILSNIVSNVPAVLLLEPFIRNIANAEKIWLTLAMATTFAGNLTLLGSVANLIVAESARLRGINISFTEYLKIGIPITFISILLGILWIIFIF